MLIRIAGVLLGAYLLGSINFAIAVLALRGLPDPRTLHSRNAGTTNVVRVGGRAVATVVLALDLARAACVEVLAAAIIPPPVLPWVGLALLAGNRFPIWHDWKGGKGVANYLGFVLALRPAGAALSALAWVVVYAVVRVPALASMAMIAALGITVSVSVPETPLGLGATALCLLLIVLGHRGNWQSMRARLRTASESEVP